MSNNAACLYLIPIRIRSFRSLSIAYSRCIAREPAKVLSLDIRSSKIVENALAVILNRLVMSF